MCLKIEATTTLKFFGVRFMKRIQMIQKLSSVDQKAILRTIDAFLDRSIHAKN